MSQHAMLQEHLAYVADPARLEHFRAAINTTVKQGDRVADLGSGSGVLGLLCLQAGAAHVHFVEHSAMIDVARQTIARAGCADRASFIRCRSQQVDLPEKVDVVVCDHVGYLGVDYGIVELLRDARRRFLKPDGRIIPASITLQLAAIDAERCRELTDGWQAEGVPGEFHWLRDYAVNTVHAVELKSADLVSGVAALGRIDLSADAPDFLSWTTGLRIERDGIVRGLAGWFDCELATEVWMTNSPLATKPIRRPQAFLPINEPVPVKTGDRLTATVMARPADNVTAWTVEVAATGRRFSHSTLQGMLLAPEDLVTANPARVAQPSPEGRARVSVLRYCDGRRTVREIEQAILSDHPNLFPSTAEISRFVAHVLGTDTV
jgi:SAM-dependent methyltransferase